MSVLNPADLQRYNALLQKEVNVLKKENHLLKRTVRLAIDLELVKNIPEEIDLTVPDEEPESWIERSSHFARIRAMLLKKTVELCRLHGVALHQDEILRCFKASNPLLCAGMINLHETLPRRLRELRAEGYLSSPTQGHYFLGPRSLKEIAR